MRLLFALPGLHQVDRGAEIAFIQVASNLARAGEDVTLIGSGPARPALYRYIGVSAIPRGRFEHYPKVPGLRSETSWEEASFLPGLLRTYRPQDFDVSVTCSYPFTNWALRARKHAGRRPAHVFVTQNGDWPARSNNSEFRFFGCDGLVCTNPDYYVANKTNYCSALIPNGVDLDRFSPGSVSPSLFNLPVGEPLVLMVSALIESKFVGKGIEAVSRLPDVHLVVAGDGPLRDSLRAKAEATMPGRFHNLTVTADRMPDLYRCANAFLHLSRDESFGNVFVEAMACGLRTIAFDLERTRWITGDTALLVPDKDLSALTNAIAAALEEETPSAMIADRASNFSWQAIAGQYRDFFEVVIARRSEALERF